MPRHLSAIPIFAIFPVQVKGGACLIPVRTAEGVHALSLTPALARDLVKNVAAHFPGVNFTPLPVLATLSLRQATEEKFLRVFEKWKAGNVSQKSICEAEGCNYKSFSAWLCIARKAEKAGHPLIEVNPVLKPGGKLL